MNGEDIRKIVGASVREARIAKGLTQEQLAELIKKEVGTINRIETGKNFVNSETFAQLCNALEVSPPVLLIAKPQIMLKDHIDYMNSITQLLQTFPQDNLKDVYKMILLLNKYFT